MGSVTILKVALVLNKALSSDASACFWQLSHCDGSIDALYFVFASLSLPSGSKIKQITEKISLWSERAD